MFTVRIPWKDAAALPRREVAPAKPVVARLGGVRVLLVEDDSNTRDVMRWTLERADALVVAVGSGGEALAQLREPEATPPAVIVCDIGLPGMSGYELIAAIAAERKAAGQRPIPACAVSAHAKEVDRRRAIDAGFELYLAKPVSAEALLDAVRELAGLNP